MWDWLVQNIATVLICLGVAAAIVLAAAVLYRDKKKGNSCGGSCGSCPMSGSCHRHK